MEFDRPARVPPGLARIQVRAPRARKTEREKGRRAWKRELKLLQHMTRGLLVRSWGRRQSVFVSKQLCWPPRTRACDSPTFVGFAFASTRARQRVGRASAVNRHIWQCARSPTVFITRGGLLQLKINFSGREHIHEQLVAWLWCGQSDRPQGAVSSCPPSLEGVAGLKPTKRNAGHRCCCTAHCVLFMYTSFKWYLFCGGEYVKGLCSTKKVFTSAKMTCDNVV